MVVIPAMLSSVGEIRALARQLEHHYLANPERHAQFALLTDWADADAETEAGDAALLRDAVAAIDALKRDLSAAIGSPALSAAAPEAALVGDRAALDRLGAQARQARAAARVGWRSGGTRAVRRPRRSIARREGTRYVVTLDSDTECRPAPARAGRRRRASAQPAARRPRAPACGTRLRHPAAARRHAAAGAEDVTLYHWLFAGQCGIDPYSAASSEVYQDLFGEGTFTGKGLLDVQARARRARPSACPTARC